MGSLIEINDTLKISKDRGFPKNLVLEDYIRNHLAFQDVTNEDFAFWNAGERLYNRPPTRVFLVEEVAGKWLYWGHAMVTKQIIVPDKTEGAFRIVKLYDPEYQRLATMNEAPAGKSYF